MADFLTASACRGLKPRCLESKRYHPRPDLVARLMRERHVARFLVAPAGFGKTALAGEYAGVVFSFDRVVWLDCRSPCFLRDLDKGSFAEELLDRNPAAELVVFDDIPRLGTHRCDALSEAVDALLSRSCEVIATLAPSCDAFARRQPDRIVLGASDLLLSDAEVYAGQRSGAFPGSFEQPVPPIGRIPVLAWGGDAGLSDLLSGIMREDLPAEVLLGIFAMLALGHGRVDEAAGFSPVCRHEAACSLAVDYPYVGIDRAREEFQTVFVPADLLARSFGPRLDLMAACAGCDGRDGLAVRVADLLAARGDSERACALMRSVALRPARGSWLAANGRLLLRRFGIMPAMGLYEAVRPPRNDEGAVLRMAHAWRLAALGEGQLATACASRVAQAPYAADGTRALAALAALRCGGEPERRRALGTLRQLLGWDGEDAPTHGSFAAAPLCGDALFWKPLADVQAHLALAPGAVAGVWEGWKAAGAHPDALALAAAWILRDAPEEGSSLAPGVRALVEAACAEEGFANLFAMAAGRQLAALSPAPPKASLSPEALAAVHEAEAELLGQRAAYRAHRQGGQDRAPAAPSDPASAPSAAHAVQGPWRAAAPSLQVRLFGGLDVQVGGEPVAPTWFRRQKVKTLLALLVLGAGRELPRDRLVEELWPDSPIDTARRNFYTLWSQLRRALATPEGDCPYLIRMQNGYKLDDRSLVSDVRRADELCQRLIVGRPDVQAWSGMLDELRQVYAGDLLPSEVDNDTIVRLRTEYRMRVVDALVTASARLADEGEAQATLWFARAALAQERAREDVYAALMRAQIDAGQRTLALETYFACRRFLADELGIDPSARTVRLYRSIIEEEEALDW